MKRVHKQFAIVAMAVVLGTALIGSAYTLWFEDLELHANVTTGELDGKIKCGTFADNDNQFPEVWADINFYPNPGKDVGEIVFWGNLDDHTYVLEIENAYPGYALDCEIEIENTGTVPFHIEIQDIEFKKNGQPLVLQNPLVCDGTLCIAGDVSPTDPSGDDLLVVMEDLHGCQIHPSIFFGETSSMIIGVNQSAMENSKYEIWIRFRINQWNESGWYGCNDPKEVPVQPVLPPG